MVLYRRRERKMRLAGKMKWSGLDSSLTPLMTASTQRGETVKKIRMGVEETGAGPAGCAIVLYLAAGDRPAASCGFLAVAAFGLRERVFSSF